MKKRKSDSKVFAVLSGIKTVLEKFFIAIFRILKALLIIIEKFLKIVAIFIIAISASLLFLVLSAYLFTSTFGVKDSPVFQDLRDRMATIYVLKLEDDIRTLEKEIAEEKMEAEEIAQ